jgi:type I restriction enzyme S subunit
MSLPRYAAYKDSGSEWLGELPAHWHMQRLKYACTVFPSNVNKHSRDDEPAIRLCNYTDVYYNERITALMPFMEATAAEEQIAKFTLKAGDTIITKDSETANDIAIAAYVPEDLPGVVCGYHLSMVRPRTGTAGAFIKRLFDSVYAKAKFAVAANGLTRVGLGQYALENVELPFPPLDEQLAIAIFLDREAAKIDALIAEQEKLIALLAEKRQATISHAVTRGLNPNAQMKDSGVPWLGEVPAHWPVQRIGALFREVNQPGNDTLPLLSVSIHDGVSDRELDDVEMDRKVTRSEDRSKYKAVQPGDLTYNMMRAWQGGFGAVSVEGMVSPAYVVARPVCGVLASHVDALLRTPNAVAEMKRHSRGVTDFRLRLYWDEFKTIQLALPPIGEQELIADFISKEERKCAVLRAEVERGVELLRERRSALIAAAVTGQIDVRGLVPQDLAPA